MFLKTSMKSLESFKKLLKSQKLKLYLAYSQPGIAFSYLFPFNWMALWITYMQSTSWLFCSFNISASGFFQYHSCLPSAYNKNTLTDRWPLNNKKLFLTAPEAVNPGSSCWRYCVWWGLLSWAVASSWELTWQRERMLSRSMQA